MSNLVIQVALGEPIFQIVNVNTGFIQSTNDVIFP